MADPAGPGRDGRDGLAGGAALILARAVFGQRYVVSSGDAVGPWVATRSRLLGPVFGLYERVLCRLAAGFIGWTPYLVGRALTFGTPRGVTAAGWAPFPRTPAELTDARQRVRSALGIPANALVIGIAGSMVWTPRYQFCYGMELVRALALVTTARCVCPAGGRWDREGEVGKAGRGPDWADRVIHRPGAPGRCSRLPCRDGPRKLAAERGSGWIIPVYDQDQ